MLLLSGHLAASGNTPLVEARKGTLQITVTEATKTRPVPCRIRIYEADNKCPLIHEVCYGNLSLELLPGQYRVVISRGYEYTRAEKLVIVEKGTTFECRIEIKEAKDGVLDQRLAVFPTIHGQRAVMRLFYQNKGLTDLEQLGFPN